MLACVKVFFFFILLTFRSDDVFLFQQWLIPRDSAKELSKVIYTASINRKWVSKCKMLLTVAAVCKGSQNETVLWWFNVTEDSIEWP